MLGLANREVTFQASFFPDHRVIKTLRHLHKGMLEVTMPWGEIFLFRGPVPGRQANIVFHDKDAMDRIAGEGGPGFGEGYMEGLWDTNDLPGLLQLMADNGSLFKSYACGPSRKGIQSIKGGRNIFANSGTGDGFYRLWLDETLACSGALFSGDPGRSLEEAQLMKYGRILDRLRPSKSDHILEIGCGFGGFMHNAARQGHRVTGITNSLPQAKFTGRHLAGIGLAHLTHVVLQDYRQISGQYDHIVSIETFEHVGEAFWPHYMSTIRKSLKPGGRAVIQSIVVQDALRDDGLTGPDLVQGHVFPDGLLPSSSRLQTEALRAGLGIRDVFCFGKDYAITLEKWLERFDAHLPKIRALGYNEEFIRKWRFHLAGSAALFRAGRIDAMQFQLCRT